jgi:hypothetical protein
LLVGGATTAHAIGTWNYVVTLNAGSAPANGRIDLADLGDDAPVGPVAVWDWRRQSIEVLDADGGWDVALDPLEWDYRVVAPIVNDVAVIGDPAVYATAGDARVADVASDGGRLRATVLGADEKVELITWTRSGGLARTTVNIPRRGWTDLAVG